MSSLPRRKILKAAAATAFGGALASTASAANFAQESGPEEWGGWFMSSAGNKHMPAVSVSRREDEVDVTLEVKHPQGAGHHISNVRVYTEERIEIATAEFNATLSTPRAQMTLRVAKGTKLYAVSNCNKHGLWYTEFTV